LACLPCCAQCAICIPVVLTRPSLLLHGIAFRSREFLPSARRRSLLLIAVRPQNFPIRCVLLYFSRTPALPFPMVAPVLAQISKLLPRLPAAARRRSLPLPTTHFLVAPVSAISVLPFFPSSSAQPLCFLSHPCNPSSFMRLRTLLRNGAPLSLLFSIASALFLSPRGCTPLSIPTTDLQASNVSTLLFTKAWRLFVLSLHLFLYPFPLFSIACSLFSKNTRGGYPPFVATWEVLPERGCTFRAGQEVST
jgi:hypothetical protein